MNTFLQTWNRVYQGRINRMQFLKGFLVLGIVFGVISAGVIMLMHGTIAGTTPEELLNFIIQKRNMWVFFPIYFIQAVFTLGLTSRRIKDVGITPFAIFLILIPYLSFALVLFLLMKKGQKGTNMYGVVPQERRSIIDIIMNA